MLLCACSLGYLSPVENAELQPDPGFASVLLIPPTPVSNPICVTPPWSPRQLL